MNYIMSVRAKAASFSHFSFLCIFLLKKGANMWTGRHQEENSISPSNLTPNGQLLSNLGFTVVVVVCLLHF